MKRPTKAIARLAVARLKDKLRSSNTARQFGFVLAEAGPGRVVLRMRVDKRHMQVHGVVHGGVLAALADTAGGLVTYVSLPGVKRVATIEMKINYLEAVEGGDGRGRGTVDSPRQACGRGGLQYPRPQPGAGGKSTDDFLCWPVQRD